jgi:hypothetical protein
MKKWLLFFTTLLFSFGTLAAESDVIDIPSSVAWIYVFIQKPDSTARGSGKEIATMIPPSEFLKNFTRYKEMARSDKAKLIVTAETQDDQWVQNQITYNGDKLHRAPYYNPGIDKVAPGAEIPLD